MKRDSNECKVHLETNASVWHTSLLLKVPSAVDGVLCLPFLGCLLHRSSWCSQLLFLLQHHYRNLRQINHKIKQTTLVSQWKSRNKRDLHHEKEGNKCLAHFELNAHASLCKTKTKFKTCFIQSFLPPSSSASVSDSSLSTSLLSWIPKNSLVQIIKAVSAPPTVSSTESLCNHRTLVTCALCPTYFLNFACWPCSTKDSRMSSLTDCEHGPPQSLFFTDINALITFTGYENSFTNPKSSPVASSVPSFVRLAAFTTVTSLCMGQIPSQVGPRTHVQVSHSIFSICNQNFPKRTHLNTFQIHMKPVCIFLYGWYLLDCFSVFRNCSLFPAF